MSDMSVAGDEDRWTILERQTAEGLPLVVRSRVGNPEIKSFEDANTVSAIICDLRPEFVRDDGMPTDLEALHALEDKLLKELSAFRLTCFHTASVTGDGRRVMYLTHAHAVSLRDVMISVSIRFGVLQIVADIELEVYRDFVTPTKVETKLNGDRDVIKVLEENGDDGGIPRKTDFWFYGRNDALKKLVLKLEPSGFSLDHWLENPEGVVITRENPVDMEAFRELTPMLIEGATEAGVEYDGWETPIVRPDNFERGLPKASAGKSFLRKLFGPK